MSFDDQTFKCKVQLFRQALRFQEIASGVFVQRVPVRYLKKLYQDPSEEDDPVVTALRGLDEVFKGCRDKDVDMASSVEAILDEHERDRNTGGAILMAWSMRFDHSSKTMETPTLVGLATLSTFEFTGNYSTDAKSMSKEDTTRLKPFTGGKWMYIDALCSTQPGVGRLLVLHAYNYAIAQKKQGLIALSYSARRSAVPESKRIFSQLGFETVIPQANFTVQMYGTWFAKSTSGIDLSGMAEDGVRVCTRTGMTERTSNTLMWRCPS